MPHGEESTGKMLRIPDLGFPTQGPLPSVISGWTEALFPDETLWPLPTQQRTRTPEVQNCHWEEPCSMLPYQDTQLGSQCFQDDLEHTERRATKGGDVGEAGEGTGDRQRGISRVDRVTTMASEEGALVSVPCGCCGSSPPSHGKAFWNNRTIPLTILQCRSLGTKVSAGSSSFWEVWGSSMPLSQLLVAAGSPWLFSACRPITAILPLSSRGILLCVS